MLNKLLTTMNNMGSTTLLHPVFNNLEQVIIFCRVEKTRPSILYLLYVKLASYIGRVLCKSRLILFRINGPISSTGAGCTKGG